MKKKKVLHVLSSNKFSGAENVACTIIKNTNELSYYCSPDGPIRGTLEDKGINYIPIKKLSVKNLKKEVKKYNIDIIHAHDYKASFISSFLWKNVKVISHLHSNFDFAKKWNIYTFTYNLVQKRFGKIIVVSKEILNDAIFGKNIKNKTIILENVVDPNEVKRLSNLSKTKNYDLIFVGRLLDIKQPLLFIDIVQNLKNEFPTIQAALLGDGDLYDLCSKKIKDNKLNKNIDLLGFKDNPFPFVKNSKIAVLPSKFEGLPMSTIEAMILGVPVVNSGVGGLATMFRNYPQYICTELKDYVDEITILLMQGKEASQRDCINLVKDYTNIKNYSKTLENIYNKIK